MDKIWPKTQKTARKDPENEKNLAKEDINFLKIACSEPLYDS